MKEVYKLFICGALAGLAAIIGFFALLLYAIGAFDERVLQEWAAPSDPQVEEYILTRCLKAADGPQSTQYNDWDEAIAECRAAAKSQSAYCPAAEKCAANLPTRADVRAILPTHPEGPAS